MRKILARLAAIAPLTLPLPVFAQTTTPISGLPTATAPTGAELVPLVQGGTTKQSALSALITGLPSFTSGAKGLAPASGGGTTNFLRADGTWAAPAGGGGSGSSLKIHPGYLSTYWYRNARASLGSGQLTVPDYLGCVPLMIENDVTITDLGIRVTTGQTGASMYVGIYSNVASRPGSLLTSVTVTPTASAANATATLTTPFATTAATGAYWACTLYNTPTTQPTVSTINAADATTSALIGQPNTTTIAGNSTGLSAVTSSPYSGGLPATAPTMAPTTINLPAVFFKAQ